MTTQNDTALAIRLDDTTDWGCQGSDEDRASYEAEVTAAIEADYPGADVSVQLVHRASPRCVVTTRDEEGRILTDHATLLRETEIEEDVIEIARSVWDAGDFWTAGETA